MRAGGTRTPGFPPYRAVDILAAKRDGRRLDPGQIAFMVRGMTEGRVPDYQAAAFLMAVAIRGMDEGETEALLDAVLGSGRVLDFSGVAGLKADKHSTGGVGDKVSLVLAPLAAACGIKVPMISGRSLGHTGGTLDKLEAIPGFRTDLREEELARVLEKTGVFISGQTEGLVPADRVMYALRDATATVPSIPLILASIVSKKIAEGAEALVFDVKAGSGSFMGTAAEARDLAERLVRLAKSRGLRARALVTDMTQPLGRAVGNALEVEEALEALSGGGPPDLAELVIALGVLMLELGGRPGDLARADLEEALVSGAARERFLAMVEAQGGDAKALGRGLPRAARSADLRAPVEGFVTGCDAGLVGRAAAALGAGRGAREETVDHAAGILLEKKRGDAAAKGERIALLFFGAGIDPSPARALLAEAFSFGPEPPAALPLVRAVI